VNFNVYLRIDFSSVKYLYHNMGHDFCNKYNRSFGFPH
jgi:hypothetical protein